MKSFIFIRKKKVMRKVVLLGLVIGLFLLFQSVLGAICGNGVCEAGEDSYTCPQDCPQPILQPAGGLNATEWQEAGYGWALFLFSPMFMATIIGIAISGIVAMKAGGGRKLLVFTITFLSLVFIFMLAGAYPSWLGIVFIIVAGALVAWFAKGAIG